MKNKTVAALSSTFLLLLSLNNASALEGEKLDKLTELMVIGCSLGQKVDLKVKADGKLSILKRGVESEFEASHSKIPTIIEFIASDELKGKQADKTRECMQHYMDKIFDAVIDTDNEANKNADEEVKDIKPVVAGGIIFKLTTCRKEQKNNVMCRLKVTSTYYDRSVKYVNPDLYDNNGHQYKAKYIKIANHRRSYRDSTWLPLISDTEMDMSILFENISTQAHEVSLLEISSYIDLNGEVEKIRVEYRDLPITK